MPPKSRSGAYRMKIGPAKARLLQYIAEAANPIAAYTNVREAEGVESIFDLYFTRVNNTITLVSDTNDKWIKLLTELDDDDYEADEQELYSAAAEGEDGFLAVLDKASEVRDYYQAKLQEVRRSVNRFYEAERITATQIAANAVASPMQLPKLKLPTFNGDKRQWPPFWDTFRSAVDDRAIPKNQKFACLQPLLTDKARKAVEGFLSSDKNYDIVVERLKKRFGNTDSLRNTLEMELHDLPRSGDRAVEVRDTFDQIERICRQLESLGVNIEHEQVGLSIERKLPKWLLLDVKRAKKADPGWTVKKLCDLIDTNLTLQEEVEQDLAVRPQPRQPKTVRPVSKLHVSTFATTTSQKQARQPAKSCVFCEEMHWFDACPTYKTYQERSQRASDLNRCSRCLKEGHGSTNCSTSFRKPCYYCKQDHASAMCMTREQSNVMSDGQKKPAQRKKGGQQKDTVTKSHGAQHITTAVALLNSPSMAEPPMPINVAANAAMHAREDVLLLARQITLRNPSWTQSVNVVALFDQGSQLSYITCKLADNLKLQPICKDQLHLSTFGVLKMQELSTPRYEIILPLLDGSTKTLIVNALDQLTNPIKAVTLPKDIDLKDKDLPRYISSHHVTAPPQILIGADYFYDIVNGTPQKHDSGLHIVQSKVGYLLCGQQGVTTLAAASVTVTRTTKPANEEKQPPSSLDKFIERFWTLESIGIMECPYILDDDVAMNLFKKSIQKLNGRYDVGFPWKSATPNLPTNYHLCLKRLQATMRRLQEEPHLLESYNKILQEQLKNGIIEIVTDVDKNEGFVTYLPHHPHITPSKTTTKCRMVFDASAKVKGGKSLNDVLYRGPSLLADMVGMLLRFRKPAIVIIGDIEKAFHQLSLNVKDRDSTRFLWVKDASKPVTPENTMVFRFQRVPFGVIASPFLLAASIRHHLEQENSDTAVELLRNTYADNIILSAQSTEEAVRKCREAKDVFRRASMNLREMLTNDEQANAALTDEDRISTVSTKVLGILWNSSTDVFSFNFPPLHEDAFSASVTKRQVLKQIASVYDPLGLLSPAVLHAKIFLQGLWAKNYGWDDSLSAEEVSKWTKIIANWDTKPLVLSRGIYHNGRTEMHVFTDASINAYAVAVYLRETTESSTEVNLIFAKSRLSPLKKPTIPRLELLAATIGAKTASYLKTELDIVDLPVMLWSDSKAVLGWLTSNSTTLPIFVSNRITQIRQAPIDEVRYVCTSDNPADLGTRGCTISELHRHSLWWHGPPWLREEEAQWPPKLSQMNFHEEEDTEAPIEELSESIDVTAASTIQDSEKMMLTVDPTRVSSWPKLVLIMAMVLRLLKIMIIDATRNPARDIKRWTDRISLTGRFTAKDRTTAEELLLKQIQQENPPSALECKQLGLQQDEKGLYRCTGRLGQSELSVAAQTPIFLPRKSLATKLLVLEVHRQQLHAGTQHTLAQIRQKFWIPKGRQTVKRIVHNCPSCKKENATPFELPKMPAYPAERVSRDAPFCSTGVDYFGPMVVKIANEKHKIWVALFTCLATRNIHLEWVSNLSAAGFLQAFRRFISRRGRPSLMISDNGTNFKLASKTIVLGWSQLPESGDMSNYLARNVIEWRFIPQLTPWAGGFYERLVAIVKSSLKKSIGRKVLSLEEFVTALSEAEAVVNCRPLTYIHDDVTSVVVRPIDLLQPQVMPGQPNFDEDINDPQYRPPDIEPRAKLLSWWKQSLLTLDKFWTYWQIDYLASLRERFQMTHDGPRSRTLRAPEIGEVVLVFEEGLPRSSWKLATIVETPRSRDNEVRIAKVRMANGNVLTRSIAHLYPLELGSEKDERESQKPEAKKSEEETKNAVVAATLGDRPRNDKSDKVPSGGRSIFYLMVLACILNIAAANKCSSIINATRIHSQVCCSSGLVIMQDINGKFCWTKVNCNKGHIRLEHEVTHSQFCGPKCDCPSWAEGCSFYEGKVSSTSRLTNEKIKTLLEQEKPDVCAFEKTSGCDHKALYDSFKQIQLYDGSKHLVKALHIAKREVVGDEFECIGKGSVTGTPIFCKHHDCVSDGTRFCYYWNSDLATLETEDGNIPIKAWGTVTAAYYESLTHHSLQIECSTCSIDCVQGGVRLNLAEGIGLIEVCSAPVCYRISHPRKQESVLLPADITISQYDVTLKLWSQGVMVKQVQRSCPPNAFCESIKCIFCVELLSNPHCAPMTAVVIIALLAYIGSSALYYTIQLLKMTFSCTSCLGGCLGRGAGRIFCGICNTCIKFICNIWPRQRPNNRRLRSGMLMTVLVFVASLQLADSCAETSSLTATEDVCLMTSKSGTIECTFSDSTTFQLRPPGSRTCFLLKDNKGRPAGSLEIEVQEIEQRCVPRSEFFTRSFSINVESATRCAAAGSCYGDQCAMTHVNDAIPELGSQANKSPGYTFCTDTPGGIFNGCLLPMQACIFYRVFAVPTSPKIYEVIECISWETTARIKLTISTSENSQEHLIALTPGATSSWNKIRATLTSMEIPQTAITQSTFITDGTRTARLNDVIRQQTYLKCPTRVAAHQMNCSFPSRICSCHPASAMIKCQCAEQMTDIWMTEDNLLPVSKPTQPFTQSLGRDIWTTADSFAARLQLSIYGLRATTKVDFNTCTMVAYKLKGCYSCRKGAVLEYQCSTDFGSALAHVSCPSAEFAVRCSAQTERGYATIHVSQPTIEESCRVTCPASMSEVKITGQLGYVPNVPSTDESESTAAWTPGMGVDLKAIFSFLCELPNFFYFLIVIAVIVIFCNFILPLLPFFRCSECCENVTKSKRI